MQSSWDAFASANSVTDANVGDFLGSYGVDVSTHTVWAVVNHNSQFSVVPEPTSLTLFALGAIAIAVIGVKSPIARAVRSGRKARQFESRPCWELPAPAFQPDGFRVRKFAKGAIVGASGADDGDARRAPRVRPR